MSRTSFLDDYSEGAHPKILEKLLDTNLSQQKAYVNDEYCEMARDCLREKLGDSTLAVHFVASGTLANIISIGSCLRPHEAVIAASTGHKIIAIPSPNGKLTPESIEHALTSNAHFPHMAKPRLVYVSNVTEMGTLYTKAELSAISDICKKRGLLLYVDGARLGAALSAVKNDLTLPDLVSLADIFWIGGTKVGMLLGEAIIISNPLLAEDFAFHVKQRGGLLARGRTLGVQFYEMFSTNLFFDLKTLAILATGKLPNPIVWRHGDRNMGSSVLVSTLRKARTRSSTS